jgi:hypothetical protein
LLSASVFKALLSELGEALSKYCIRRNSEQRGITALVTLD